MRLGRMQVESQMMKIVMNFLRSKCGSAAREKASTQPLAQRVRKTLRKTKKKPQCHLSDGRIWQGPILMNFDIPIDAEKTDNPNVVQKMMILGIPNIPRSFVLT